MATVVERTGLNGGKRVLLIGLAGLLLAGIAGGLVGIGLQSDEPVLGSGESATTESAPAITGTLANAGTSTDIEALRAQQFAPTPRVDIEAVRAGRYAPTAPAPARVMDIEAVRAQRYASSETEAAAPAPVLDIEAVRAQQYEAPAPGPVDIEALRAQRYGPAPAIDIEAMRAAAARGR
jgi:hypothetical protein